MKLTNFHLLLMSSTDQNFVISPNNLVWKLCGKAQSPHRFSHSPDTVRTKFPPQEIR